MPNGSFHTRASRKRTHGHLQKCACLTVYLPPLVCAACSMEEVLHNIDTAIQYGEDTEVKVRDLEGPQERALAGDDDDDDDT